MSTYIIGDVQGCYLALDYLVKTLNFDPKKDKLWFTGDLVNRGPDSLSTLRYVKSLGKSAVVVLGNHDLTLLGVAKGLIPYKKKDNIDALLAADDKNDLIAWLQQQPLLHHDETHNVVMVHAGIPPQWSLEEAKQYAKEVESVLQSDQRDDFLKVMFGNMPDTWQNTLSGPDRWRYIVNAFTRMRFCDTAGRLEFTAKGAIKNAPLGFDAWFNIKTRKTAHLPIYFGHWAALEGKTKTDNANALDTGCVWGGCLTAACLETGKRTSIICQ